MHQENTKIRHEIEAKDYAKAAIDNLLSARGISGYGGYHTAKPNAHNPKPYTDISFGNINSLVKNPESVPKEKAQWAIFSTTGGPYARVHQYQRDHGQFFCSWGDLDEVSGLTMLDVFDRVKAALPDVHHIIYSSRSARPDLPKSRVLVPLSGWVPGRDYSMIQKILNDRLESSGLPPDRATERPGQLCYLPNRGEYYQFQINDGPLLDPYQAFESEIIAEQARLKAEQQERDRRHQAAIQKAQERISTGQADPIEAFRQNYPVELALERYGYYRRGKKYLSPLSESGKPGVTVLDNKWYSHHSSDAGIGQPGKDGGSWGDAFDLFVYFEHGGDFRQAVRAAGEMFITTDQQTGQVISITQANQREYMRQQDAPEQDFQGKQTKPSEQTWEAPISLNENTPPAMDPNILPGPVGDMARAVSIETETPVELAMGIGLSAIATACQGKITIKIKPGYQEPLNLWVVVALDPANRKTSVLSKMTAPLTEWERDQSKTMEPWIKEAVSRRQNQESRIKALRARYGKAKVHDELKKIEAEILEIENDLEEIPVPPKAWAQDITPEHLGTLMAQHKERMSILSAEGGIFDIAAGRYSSGVPNLDLFLQGHAGDAVRVDRGSREPVYMDHPALTFGLSPQPGVLRGLTDKPGFRSRGLLARFLYFLPGSKLGYRVLDTTPVPGSTKSNYHNLIYKLLDLEPGEDEQPHTLTLSLAAYREWAEFYMTVEKDLREGGRFEYITDWAGKLPGAAARIAGLLHCADNPHEPWTVQVSLQTIGTALDLAAVFADHALIAFDLMGADTSLEGARKAWRWIEKNRFDEFTKRDCFNALKATFHRVANIEDPLKILEERNYIQAETKKTGGRPSIIYRVNTKGWS